MQPSAGCVNTYTCGLNTKLKLSIGECPGCLMLWAPSVDATMGVEELTFARSILRASCAHCALVTALFSS